MVDSVQSTSSALPDWLKPYLPNLLSSASSIAQQPYQAYGGQRIAGFNPLQTKAIAGVGGLGPTQSTFDASKMVGDAGTDLGNAGSTYAYQATNPYTTAAYMSPYMQNVVEQQKRSAVQDYSRQIPGMQASAARVGGMGGTRNALARSEAQRNLNQQLQGIQATGSQSAFDSARQAQQFGANLGLQGLQAKVGAAQALGGLGQQEFNQRLQALQEQQKTGAGMQNLEQQRLNQMYEDFMAQRNYPQQQAGFMADILRGGSPSAASLPTTTTTSQGSPSLWGTALGILGQYMAGQYSGG